MIARRSLLQATALVMLPGAGMASDQRLLRFVFSRPQRDPRTQWLIRLYTDACAMLGRQFEFVDVPAKRATAMVLSSEVDGELGRTAAYQQLHPRLRRVDEPNNSVSFCVYGLARAAPFVDMAQARNQVLRCETRRGIHEMEAFLQQHMGRNHSSEISEVWQGIRKLQLGRTDLYFDVREAVEDYLNFKGCGERPLEQPKVERLATIATTTGHCYLNQKHASLAPELARVLAQLKASGTSARYLNEELARYALLCG